MANDRDTQPGILTGDAAARCYRVVMRCHDHDEVLEVLSAGLGLGGLSIITVAQPAAATAPADERELVRAAYTRMFGSDDGWHGEPGSWFTEGFRAALAVPAAPMADIHELAAYAEGSKSPRIVRASRAAFAWLAGAPHAQAAPMEDDLDRLVADCKAKSPRFTAEWDRLQAAVPHFQPPRTAADVRDFIEGHYSSLTYGNPHDGDTPSDNDEYLLTAHDLLSAFSWFVDDDQDTVPAAPQAQPSDDDLLATYREAIEHAERCNQGFSYGSACALRAVLRRYGAAPQAGEDALAKLRADLQDPGVVHANMCRGIIAPITFDQLAHILGDEAVQEWLAKRGEDARPVALGAGDENIKHLAMELVAKPAAETKLLEAARFLEKCYSAAPQPLQAGGQRTPQDYSIEHAEYMAVGAEFLIDAVNAHALAREADDDEDIEGAKEVEDEARGALRNLIYEFRKRRDRAASAAGLQAGQGVPLDYMGAMKIIDTVMEQYKVDQPKWWRRMDGTPILNDLPVRMAVAFGNAGLTNQGAGNGSGDGA